MLTPKLMPSPAGKMWIASLKRRIEIVEMVTVMGIYTENKHKDLVVEILDKSL